MYHTKVFYADLDAMEMIIPWIMNYIPLSLRHKQGDQKIELALEELIVNVPLDKMPGEVEIGQTLEASGQDGQSLQVTIVEINEDNVVIDGNHPLAGKDLIFEIEIVSVQ